MRIVLIALGALFVAIIVNAAESYGWYWNIKRPRPKPETSADFWRNPATEVNKMIKIMFPNKTAANGSMDQHIYGLQEGIRRMRFVLGLWICPEPGKNMTVLTRSQARTHKPKTKKEERWTFEQFKKLRRVVNIKGEKKFFEERAQMKQQNG